MTKYWAANELADAPGMHPNLAYEIRQSNRTPHISEDAIQAGYVTAVNEVVIPTNLPLALPPNTGGAGQPVYLRTPTPWEFYKLERGGILCLGESYIFLHCSLH